jgi:hypothetical protein
MITMSIAFPNRSYVNLRKLNPGCGAALSAIAATSMFWLCSSATATPSYVPATIGLQDSSGAALVCVIGSSKGASPATPPGAPAAYYLVQPEVTAPAPGTLGGTGSAIAQWIPAGASNIVKAIQIGGTNGITGFAASPIGQPYINSANLSIYVIKTLPAGGFSCANNIQYTMDNLGNFTRPTVNYPSGLFEETVWQTSVNSVLSPVITLDTSNVDNFQIPLAISINQGANVLGNLGNRVVSPTFTRQTMITGPNDAGGASSPLVTWLGTQPPTGGGGPALNFQNLALAAWPSPGGASTTSPQYPFAYIISPNDYLNLQCQVNASPNPNVPSNCSLNGDLVNWFDPLNSYYNGELSTFFTNALVKNAALVVMGDTGTPVSPDVSPVIPEQPWTVTARTSCPVYLNADSQSLLFSGVDINGKATSIKLCNPVGQVVNFPSTGVPASSIHQTTPTSGAVQTYEIDLTQAQYSSYSQYKNWYFGQPSSGWVGQITSFKTTTVSNKTVYQMWLNALNGPSTTNSNATPCIYTTGNPCPAPNPSFTEWVFSNITWTSNNKWSETPSQMVFANDGAFASWDYYNGNTSLAKVSRSIQRNIVNAFSRGIANCNNVTMNTGFHSTLRTTLCAKVKPITLKADAKQTTGGFNPSDQYWSNEANWYPAGGHQSYYSQYLHTAQLSTQNIFWPPNNSITPTSTSNQGVLMGMVYGYGFDENPVYVAGSPPPFGNVPSKLDPIPSSWFATPPVTVTVTVGPLQ